MRGIEAGTGITLWAHHVISRNAWWWKEDDPNPKDLRRIGRDLTKTLLIDNNPACGQLQLDSAVIVEDFDLGAGESDDTLLGVSCLLQHVSSEVTRGASVQEALASSSMLCLLSFDLAPEHIVGKVASRISANGLIYSTGSRTYAGEKPV